MTEHLVPRLLLTTLLASALSGCSGGTDAPYTGMTPTPSTSGAPSSTATSVSPTATGSMSSTGWVSPSTSGGMVSPSSNFDTSKRFGTPTMTGSGSSGEQYKKADVTRDGRNYYLMSNGWGPGYQSQSIAWDGTAFTVVDMQGEQGPNYEPATYPTVFCGVYSDAKSKECGLPAEVASLTSLRTGWSWTPADAGSNEQYNAAYDIWMANGTARSDFSGFFMVWLRDPPRQQPAGSFSEGPVTVANVPGQWDIWEGTVFDRPIINYVREEGEDTLSLEFDVLEFIKDAAARGYQVPGTHVLSVAVGFEIWNGPIKNLKSNDFYVEVQ